MKKFNKKNVITILIILMFQVLIYFISKIIQGEPHLLVSILDDKFPFLPCFIYFYVLWYVLIVLLPYVLSLTNKDEFKKYCIKYIICILVSAVIYVIYPTIINRPEILNNDLTSSIIKLVYLIDTPSINCLPSFHCIVCFLFIISFQNCKNIKLKLFVNISSILIVLSTLFIKQHVLIDIILAYIIVIVVSIIVEKSYKTSFDK